MLCFSLENKDINDRQSDPGNKKRTTRVMIIVFVITLKYAPATPRSLT